MTHGERDQIEQRWGVLFQHGALFSNLTVKQNIQAPMREHLGMSRRLRDELAMLKIALVGLPVDAANKFPSELSGGMIKRAALARALALDPGHPVPRRADLRPRSDRGGRFRRTDLPRCRRRSDLTVFMVTHDLDSLYAICDRVAALGQGRVIAVGPIAELLHSDDPWLKAYFHGKRGEGRCAGELTADAAAAPDRRLIAGQRVCS